LKIISKIILKFIIAKSKIIEKSHDLISKSRDWSIENRGILTCSRGLRYLSCSPPKFSNFVKIPYMENHWYTNTCIDTRKFIYLLLFLFFFFVFLGLFFFYFFYFLSFTVYFVSCWLYSVLFRSFDSSGFAIKVSLYVFIFFVLSPAFHFLHFVSNISFFTFCFLYYFSF
jgi:hypothetical protein